MGFVFIFWKRSGVFNGMKTTQIIRWYVLYETRVTFKSTCYQEPENGTTRRSLSQSLGGVSMGHLHSLLLASVLYGFIIDMHFLYEKKRTIM